MNEGRRRRRRRGGRGGGESQPEDPKQPREQPPGPQRSEGPQRPPGPGARRGMRGDRPPGQPGGAGQRPGSRRDGPRRDGERRPQRVWEPPVPQDERSKELGALFRESQNALRDARKTLDKRKAESADEPQWLLDAYTEAEGRFEAASTAWQEHLAATGRRVVRG